MSGELKGTDSVFKQECEKYEELSGTLQAAVLIPLENTIGTLRMAWKDDAASEIFLTRLYTHFEAIRAAQRQMQDTVRELERLCN